MSGSLVSQMLIANRVQVYNRQGVPQGWPMMRSKALMLVAGGRAMVQGPNRIRMLWGKDEFPRYIRERDRFTCTYCGQFGNTVDHVWPRSRGGLCTPANCVCACRECNGLKGALSVIEFVAVVREMRCTCYTFMNGVLKVCQKHRILNRAGEFLWRFGNLGQELSV